MTCYQQMLSVWALVEAEYKPLGNQDNATERAHHEWLSQTYYVINTVEIYRTVGMGIESYEAQMVQFNTKT